MAATITKLHVDNSSKRSPGERGQFAVKAYKIVFPANATPTATIDMDLSPIGARSAAIFVDCSVAAKNYTISLKCSNDNSNKTTIPRKDLTGTETAAGNSTVNAASNKHLIVEAGSYPQAMAQRYLHLDLTPAANPTVADTVYVYVTLK